MIEFSVLNVLKKSKKNFGAICKFKKYSINFLMKIFKLKNLLEKLLKNISMQCMTTNCYLSPSIINIGSHFKILQKIRNLLNK